MVILLMRSAKMMRWNMVKNQIITTRTTDDLYHRFKKLCEKKNWKGDDWIIMFLAKFEDEQDFLRSQINVEKSKLRKINKDIQDLENQKIGCLNLIEEMAANVVGSDDGVDDDVRKAVDNVLQRFRNQSIYSLSEFLEFNKDFVQFQAFLWNVELEDLERRIIEKA